MAVAQATQPSLPSSLPPGDPSPGRSEAQRRASRENGAKSRGPKTREGKDRSRWGSLKHEAYASDHAITDGVLAENEDEYHQGMDDFLLAVRPSNAAAGRMATRMYHDLRKHRLDLLEALGVEQRGVRRDFGDDAELEIYELNVRLLDGKIEAAERAEEDLYDLAYRYTRDHDELTTHDWLQLCGIAEGDEPTLIKWDDIICNGAAVDDDASYELGLNPRTPHVRLAAAFEELAQAI